MRSIQGVTRNGVWAAVGRGCTATVVAIFALLWVVDFSAAEVGRDPRLFLHWNSQVSYSIGTDPGGLSGEPLCENAIVSAPITNAPILWYVISVFPEGQSIPIVGASFGINYDPSRLEIVANDFPADKLELSPTWPAPGSGIRCTWSSARAANPQEIGWFAGYVLGEEATVFQLEDGPLGGDLLITTYAFGERIAEFGALGFGVAGGVECAVLGTCCFERGDCATLTQSWCARRRGIFFDGEDCTQCATLGACCDDARCRIRKESGCLSDETAEWLGEGTECDPVICVPIGSCCLPDGGCEILNLFECRDMGGFFTADKVCTEIDCRSLGGACCYYGDLVCTIRTEEDCEIRGAEFLGEGSTCEPAPCAPGLCCIDAENTDCEYTTEPECDALGGEFLLGSYGPAEKACLSFCFPPPVKETSWGQIKRTFRSGDVK